MFVTAIERIEHSFARSKLAVLPLDEMAIVTNKMPPKESNFHSQLQRLASFR